MFIATLIAEVMRQGDVTEARDRLSSTDIGYRGAWRAVQTGVAYDFRFASNPHVARAVLEGAFAGADLVIQREDVREKRLLIADMDSTMITVECLDELADYAGLKTEIAAVTERAMRGEVDFAAALDARVALLAGLEEESVARCLADRVRIMPGAETLVRTMRARGGRAVLVSGGFTGFAEPIAKRIGFDRVVSNRLEIKQGKLTGEVARPIVDADAKLAVLEEEIRAADLPRPLTMAIGDGANDLPMIRQAGLGVAYHAKPIVAAAADARIDHGDLSTLLYAQGIPRGQWAI